MRVRIASRMWGGRSGQARAMCSMVGPKGASAGVGKCPNGPVAHCPGADSEELCFRKSLSCNWLQSGGGGNRTRI